MAYSIYTTTGDGVTATFPINFTLGILKREYVKCRVGNEVDGLGAPVYRTLTWITDGLVTVGGAIPGNGVTIVFTRTVPKDELIHDYSDGTPIIEENLDESNLQLLMAIEEFLDGRLDGGGFIQDINMNTYRIVNLGDAIDDGDAVNFAQLKDYTGDAPGYAAAAAASAASASGSATTAGNAATAANQSAIDAAAANAAAQAAAAGMKAKNSVRFSTIVNDTLSGLAARNGITPIAGDRVLVMAQTTTSQNGIYIAAAGAWTRSTDADTWTELVSAMVITEEASGIAGVPEVPYICTVNSGGTIGVTAVTFVLLPVPIADLSITFAKLSSGAIASSAQIIAGSSNNTLITPAALRSAFSGLIIDNKYAEYKARTALAPTIPFDDTIPQVTEGTEVLSVTITPKTTTNRVRIRATICGVTDGANQLMIAALFLNGGTNAIAANATTVNGPGGVYGSLVLEFEHVPGATSAQTYSIRVGGQIGNLYLNSGPSGRVFGGVGVCTLVASEIIA